VVAVEGAREHALFVKVFVRYGDDEITPRPHHAQPILQTFAGVTQMFQAVTAVDKIELAIRHANQKLGIAVLDVPGTHILHPTKKLPVENKRIGLAADVESPSRKVARGEVHIGQAPRNGLAALFHKNSGAILRNMVRAATTSMTTLTSPRNEGTGPHMPVRVWTAV
jgi:hypothetical protein